MRNTGQRRRRGDGGPIRPSSGVMTRPRDIDAVREHIEAHPVSGPPEEMRAAFEALAGPQPSCEQVRIGGHDALAVGRGPQVILFHGGGYVFGSPASHLTLAATLAERGLRVLLPTYRLAPERPWPAQLTDALAVLDDADMPLLAGISAGGHLALNAALARPGRVRALALLSPNTDRTGRSETRGRNSDSDAMNSDEDDARLAGMAMGHLPPDDPTASPVLADLSALPSLWIGAWGAEVLLDDALLLARAAGLAGVGTMLDVREGHFHMAELWPDAIPEASRHLAAMGDWLADQAARTSASMEG